MNASRKWHILLLISTWALVSCDSSQAPQANQQKPADEATFRFPVGSATIHSYFDFYQTRSLLEQVVRAENEFELKTKGKVYGDLDYVTDGKKETYLFFVAPVRALCIPTKQWRCYHLSESDYYWIVNSIRRSLNLQPVTEGAPIFPEFGITGP